VITINICTYSIAAEGGPVPMQETSQRWIFITILALSNTNMRQQHRIIKCYDRHLTTAYYLWNRAESCRPPGQFSFTCNQRLWLLYDLTDWPRNRDTIWKWHWPCHEYLRSVMGPNILRV
jgi:hypothetical protein